MKDRFSATAKEYARYRPVYPDSLFEFLASLTTGRDAAWDCATGNGQTATALAKFFKAVHATDISQEQLDQAAQVSNVHYSRQSAEKTNFAIGTFDLVTVSQAMHWFDLDSFYKEAKRVSRPGGVIAAWCYSLMQLPAAWQDRLDHFYTNIIGKYWDDERKLVDEKYQTIPFPFAEISSPVFSMKYHWKLQNLDGYLRTWSAVQQFTRVNGTDPVIPLIEELQPLALEQEFEVLFPLHLRVGRILK